MQYQVARGVVVIGGIREHAALHQIKQILAQVFEQRIEIAALRSDAALIKR